ncbi:protein-glutamate O-methyltransferase CheR [Desulfobulbus sp.]|jgi:chemotaxis protein methyltransferase CheR|uniref:CheR family methyltransferase n=1 Tax=Desulfobulbus sp. TaxID=895 RepID=UPI0027BA941B|nr:protein-glutamate O-methyltransferase CheR [Desulfobulbus sp.]
MLKITPEEIKLITKYIYEISGIYLDESKKYLLETRLNAIAEEQGCSSYQDFHRKAKADASKLIERKIIDAISTNETLFFRDTGPFQLLQHKILPELIDARAAKSSFSKTNLKIWSAASSTGQELYSIAIVLQELLGDMSKYSIKLIGTDISDAAVAQASSGKYNKFEIERGLARDKLTKYFSSVGQTWKVNDQIRAMANFRKFNLMSPFIGLGKFDIVLCRNVAIYFTLEDRKKLFNKIADVLEPDGYLIIGSTESLTGICPRFIPKRHLRSIFYQLK